MALLAGGVTSTAGAPLAAVWLGLALLGEELRKALSNKISERNVRMMLDGAVASGVAASAALAWFAPHPMGTATAVAMLGAIAVHTMITGPTLRQALPAIAPSVVLAFVFAASSGSPVSALGILACIGFATAATLYVVNVNARMRDENAELVRQLNMTHAAGASATWEADFTTEALFGADRLEHILGRVVTYRDIVENACFAPAAERDLVRAAFGSDRTTMRAFALEHDVIRSDGSRVRVRHQGFMRTLPDGTPARLTCTTEPSAGAAADLAALSSLVDQTEQTLAAQARSFMVISNELSHGGTRTIPTTPETTPKHANTDPISRLETQLTLIEQRRAVIANSINELVHAHHEAQAANIAKSQFLAGMSHELRTPLNAIIGYAEMLQEDAEDKGDSPAAQDLSRILAAARHLLTLINEILDLSKIEAGRLDVSPAHFDAGELLEDLLETVRPLAEQNRNTLSLACDVPPNVAHTDATRLRQCVLNLLSNACKFTKDGKIDVSVSLRDHHGVSQIFVTVADTGIGMSDDHMSRLFQPFVQADASITRQYGGTGLGLTITRRLAQLLGGDVSVESALGQGATFTLHVPALFQDAAAARGAAAPIDAPQGAPDAPLVVVIEDEADARELVARALTRAGFAVQGVGGGDAGLTLARAKSPALVLLDIFLPDRSGWRVLQSLKQDPKTRDIPVIVLSVNEDRAHALALGAAEHMIKPADRDVLAATVMRYARQRPNLAAAIMAPPAQQKQTG